MPLVNIAILRALNGLGDFICATPALRALRHHFADARISFIGLAADHPVATRFGHLVDRFVPFPGFPGIPEHPFDINRLLTFLDDLPMQPEIDLAVQLHGDGTVTNPFVALLGARRIAGFHLSHQWRPDPELFLPYPHLLPEPERWLSLARHLGGAGDIALEFPVSTLDRSRAQAARPAGRYAVLHPGASQPDRRWPAREFAAVGDALAGQGLAIVLTGVGDERTITAEVAARMTRPVLDLAGCTDLGTAAALIEQATIVVTNDTGTSHLAAALRTPSVVVFTGSDRGRWAPIDRVLHRAVGGGHPDPTPGLRDRPPRAPVPHRDDVLAAAADLLQTTA